MRRSSCIVLTLAGILFVAAALLYASSFNTTAPPIDDRVAEALIERGKRALEDRDTEGIMDLMGPTAVILEHKPDEIRDALHQTMRELRGHLTVNVKNISARQDGAAAFVKFDMDVKEKTDRMDATYYPNLHMRIKLEKIKSSHWLGLFSTEEWKIVQVDCDTNLDVTIP